MSDALKELIEFQHSLHAATRQRQRGISNSDIEMVMRFGEQVDDGYVLTERALEIARRDLKQILQRLDHLAGVAVIEQGGTLVTTYRADARRIRRLRSSETRRASDALH